MPHIMYMASPQQLERFVGQSLTNYMYRATRGKTNVYAYTYIMSAASPYNSNDSSGLTNYMYSVGPRLAGQYVYTHLMYMASTQQL